MNVNHFNYLLELSDDSVILGQRLGEWCGHGPVIEIDMALTNTSLDLFGQSRSLYQYASELEGKGKSEDELVAFRDACDFRNCLLVEQPNGDFAQTIVRQYFFDAYQYFLFSQLKESRDERLAAIAAKSIKETAYHLRFSREWMKRLGDGTEESHQRLQDGVNKLWRFTNELFVDTECSSAMREEGIGADLNVVRTEWSKEIKSTFELAGLTFPEPTVMQKGGRMGHHTEHLGYILTEMQFMQRAYPGQEW
jgi:ring-1,2-phenylacetyl-CoA epoxidase subunit PaaC